MLKARLNPIHRASLAGKDSHKVNYQNKTPD
jgi:hypothetical protein